MRAEVQKIFILYEELVEAGNNATLMFSSNGGKSTIKLQLESPSPSPLTATTTTLPPAPERRRRHRGAAARARRRQRAADHQAALAQAATSALLVPPCRPLHILPSPPTASGRRRVMSVGRPDMPTFSSLNLDGNPPIPPSPPTISPPTSPLINPWIPCMNNCDIPDEHCEHCFKCSKLCSEHQGCSCEPIREYRIVHSPLDHTRYIIGSKDLWCTQCKQQHETQPM